MMVDLKVMAYFKISLSTRNWDRAFFICGQEGETQALLSALCSLLSALWHVVTPLLYAISVV
ncbi:hypothetical protein C2U29_20200 [Aeromonas veronii]|nr:hypothetical protein C2U29_20200 [Aeromonas veronii]